MSVTALSSTKQPGKLYALFFTEMWERYGFYTIRAVLVLYMTKVLLLGNDHSYAIFGAFTALLYLTPTMGGFLADRLFGFRTSIYIGGVIFIIGYLLLAIPKMLPFYLGLSMVTVGNGFFKPNVSSIVGGLYEPNDPRREGGFSIFYAGINLGAMIPPLLIAGLIALFGWGSVFVMAAVGVLFGLIVFTCTISKKDGLGLAPVLKNPKKRPLYWSLTALGALVALIGLALLIDYNTIANWALFMGGGLFVSYSLLKSFTYEPAQRNRLLLCHLLIIFSIIFWVLYQQSGSALTIYTEFNANRYIQLFVPFTHWHETFKIPTVAYQSVNPLVIIIFAPILSWLWTKLDKYRLNPSIPAKFAFGTILMGLGFVLIPWVSHHFSSSSGQINQWWINFSYLLQSVGELMLSPVGLSMVTELSPAMMVGLMMGAWFFASAVANALAGVVAQWTTVPSGSNNPLITNPAFNHVFNWLGWISVISGVVVLILTPQLKKMIGTIKGV